MQRLQTVPGFGPIVASAAKDRGDPLRRWVNRLRETRGMNKATVALANKLARIGWAVLRHGTTYQAVRG